LLAPLTLYLSPRSLEIIAAGCRHYGVREDYVTALLTRPCEPRPAPADFLSVEVPAGVPTWDEARLAAEPASDDSVTVALDGVVTRLTGGSVFHMYKRMNVHGKHMELILASALYDPKYGAPSTLEAFSREHTAYLRDFMQRNLAKTADAKAEVVAVMRQRHCDDEPGAGDGAAAS
jgi:hypothetical protein